MTSIHPTAIVDPAAELGQDVIIGPYSIIEQGVTLGSGTVVFAHSHIQGNMRSGVNCRFGPAAYVGLPPQHSRHDGKGAWLIIGDRVIIRETASVHRSIRHGQEHATRIGNGCFLMGGSHVGHDCQLGNDVTLANTALLGGHCQVGDKAFIGGGATIHQFVRIGRLAIVSGNEAFTNDVPPFSAARYRGLKGYNAIGCKRSGMSRESIHSLRAAFHCIHHHRTVSGAVDDIQKNVESVPEVEELLQFIAASTRGILPSVKFQGRNGEMRTATSYYDDED